MSYIALYRKWRPLLFEDVVEQEHVVKTLRNSVATGRIAHAYLFCGTRGTGKTTMAKIFSRAINCLEPRNGDPCNQCDVCKGILSESILDVVEIDAASNNSVDNVRDIRDGVVYAPSHARYKVYIIDEVHMLSTGAFNALLKTLEEPPEHVVFILATTDPHKLPATILSRCQRFDFRRISIESIVGRLNSIADANGIILKREASRLIARMADGALRDAISILDQCIGMGNAEISYNDVLTVVGIVNDSFIAQVVDAVNNKDVNSILEMVDKLVMDGKNIVQFVSDLVQYYRDLLICRVTDKATEIIDASDETLAKMQTQCANFGREDIIRIIKELSSLESSLKWSTHPRILLEVSLIRICESEFSNAAQSYQDILERLNQLETKIKSGTFTSKAVSENSFAYEVKSNDEKKPDKKTAGGSKPQLKEVKVQRAEKALDNWEEVLKELKNSGRMVIYTNLLGTRAVELQDNVVGIVFDSKGKFAKMLVSKVENVEIIEDILGKKLGREIRVKCLGEDDLSIAESIAEPEKDELVVKAQEFAEKLNVPINFFDE